MDRKKNKIKMAILKMGKNVKSLKRKPFRESTNLCNQKSDDKRVLNIKTKPFIYVNNCFGCLLVWFRDCSRLTLGSTWHRNQIQKHRAELILFLSHRNRQSRLENIYKQVYMLVIIYMSLCVRLFAQSKS